MAVPAGYDIGLDSTDPADANAVRGFMLVDHRQQDITPSSARRADGDTRFQLIPSESFWSQSDFAGGFGRMAPYDPTMFRGNEADTVDGSAILPAWDWTAMDVVSSDVLALCTDPSGVTWVVLNAAGMAKLYTIAAGANAVVHKVDLPSTNVTSLVFYRGDVWIGFGAAANVRQWDTSAAALLTPAPGFQAQVLCPYTSMLFYVHFDTTTDTWRINRYDPENTTAVAALAILPFSNVVADYPRSMVALGPDLFLVCQDTLWKFTSSNGNSGVLVGPVDVWLPAGIGGHVTSGYGACAWQGALYYGAGMALRRHQPGGVSRQIWPVAPNYAGIATNAAVGIGLHPTALLPSEDRLYIGAAHVSTTSTTTSHDLMLLCWTGAGMHWLATKQITAGAAVTQRRVLGSLSQAGYAHLALAAPVSTPAAGNKFGFFQLRHSAAAPRLRQATTTWRTSILDFGMVDLDKVISEVGLLVAVPALAGHDFAVTLYVLDESTSPASFVAYALATEAGIYGGWDAPSMVYFTRASSPTILVGKQFYVEVTITSPTSPSYPPEVRAITCIPNPVYPVRYGFNVSIPLGTHVRLHSGEMAYANQAAVDAALAYLRAMRASSYPFTLDWIDGQSYTVRCNTISIVRDLLRPNESAWVARLDLQQLSG